MVSAPVTVLVLTAVTILSVTKLPLKVAKMFLSLVPLKLLYNVLKECVNDGFRVGLPTCTFSGSLLSITGCNWFTLGWFVLPE
jgi:hypothetical protein